MKKLLGFLAFTSFFITACSSDDSGGAATGVVLLKKAVETDENGDTFTTKFSYNGTKLVKITDDENVDIVFTYNGDFIAKMEYKFGNQVFQTDSFTYNTAGNLESYVRVEPLEDLGSKEVYTYNTDGTITATSYSGDANSQTLMGDTSTITMLNGEVAKIEPGFGQITTYTYDNKNHPFKNVTGFGKISFIDGEASGILHNIVTEVWGSETYQETYTYNANDYPESVISVWEGEETTTEFFY